MRAAGLALLATLVLGAAMFWGLGLGEPLLRWASEGQRMFQSAMAGALRALRAGDPGALTALLAMCFAYGFFHAVGPGHGKILIGGYGLARRVRMAPLAGLAVMSSLAQSVTAILLVYGGLWLLGWGRVDMETAAETVLAPLSSAAIAGIGLWLAWRGLRVLMLRARAQPATSTGACCGHSHGPAPDDVARLTSLRDALVLVAGVAIRPCTGALFLLLVTWRMDVVFAGILGTFAMGIGTSSVTIAVALVAASARESAFAALPGAAAAQRIAPVLEVSAGLLVATLALSLLV